MPTFPHQFKLLGAIGWCRVANMVLESEISSLIYQNKLQSTPIPRLRPTRAAREGEC
jgi:hypothetical protein